MNLRRTVIATLAALGALAVGTNALAQTVLKAADVHPAGYPNVVAVESLGKKLEAATNGKYKLQMFPGGVLGAEKEVVEQTQVGAIQIARISLGVLGPVVPAVNVFNMPFVFRDEVHMRKIIDGPIGQEILDAITNSPARLVALGYMDSGSRSLYTKKEIKSPADLRKLKESDLPQVAAEVRAETINAVAVTGGHLGSGLGVVELTVAIHHVFNTPADRVIWDVGHQAYPHKILTERRDRIRTLRQGGGLSGFTKRSESEYDPFGAAHSSTSSHEGAAP